MFKDANDAENWAKGRVNDLIEAINNQRQSASECRCGKKFNFKRIVYSPEFGKMS